MRRFGLFTLITMLMSALLTGCSTDSSDNPSGPASLTLKTQEVAASAEGGRYTVYYTLENPVANTELRISSQHGWVTNFDTTKEGEISFDVKSSYEDDARQCRVEIIYPGLYPNPTFTVKQEAGLEPSFRFEVKQVMSNTIVMDVIPADKEMPYVFLLGKKDYMVADNLLEDDAAQVASDLTEIGKFGEAFGATVQDVIGAFMYQGDQEGYTWNGVSRNTEYVAYAYGFDVRTMQPTTEVCRVEIKTLDVELYAVHFDFEVECDGPNVSFDITPKGYDGYYFFGIFAAADCPQGTSEDLIISYCEASWEEYKGIYSPFYDTPEEGLHHIFGELAYKGKTHFETELTADTEWVLWAFGMNDEALLNSTPELYYFRTGEPAASENVITLSVTDIRARQATVTTETSNDDPYIASVVAGDRFEGMSDEEIMEYICANWSLNLTTGGFTTTATGLKPESDYLLLAFGINGGKPSTELFKCPFTTTEAVTSQAHFEMRIGHFYDTQEVAALNPSLEGYTETDLICLTEVVVDDSASEVYYSVLDAETFDFFTQDGDETLIEMLISDGPSDELSSLFLLDYGLDFVFFGFVIDQHGDYTALWRSDNILFEKENRSPAQEFLDMLPSDEASPASRKKVQSVLNPLAPKAQLHRSPLCSEL